MDNRQFILGNLDAELIDVSMNNEILSQLSSSSLEMFIEHEEFLNQGSWEIDFNTGRTLFSPGMYKIFGSTSLVNQKDLNILVNDVKRYIKSSSIPFPDCDFKNYKKEFEIVDGIGTRKRVEAFGKVICNNENKSCRFVGVVRDISKLKEYEKALESKIDELNRSNKELEEFVYIASHDLYEPLRKVSTFGQRLSLDAKNELSEKNQDYLKRMLNAVDNMRNLIDHLLDYSRVSRGAVISNEIVLNEIVSDVLVSQELKIEETKARIEINQLPVIQGVPVLITQLFDNIIGNALKFKKRNISPIIQISSFVLTREDKLKYKLTPNITYHQISISDNGIGFENIYADKIFQIFQRLNGKSEFSGSGIGLAICRKITDIHKGIIFSDSKQGVGSTFHLILPESQ